GRPSPDRKLIGPVHFRRGPSSIQRSRIAEVEKWLDSQPLGDQGSSQQIGSDADDVTPSSQMLRGGIPRGVNHGDRLAAPGSEKPAIHQSKARLPNSQFQRSEPA